MGGKVFGYSEGIKDAPSASQRVSGAIPSAAIERLREENEQLRRQARRDGIEGMFWGAAIVASLWFGIEVGVRYLGIGYDVSGSVVRAVACTVGMLAALALAFAWIVSRRA